MTASRRLPRGLAILHQDRDILVVDKPAGLLTISTSKERERTAIHLLMDYVRKGNTRSRERVFIVHRLDRETSGVLVFARSEAAKFRLQEQWERTRKTYLAVVHGQLTETSGTISTYLVERGVHLVHSTPDAAQGKLSHTRYRVLKEAKDFSLLEVELLTGRKHQIRVHLAGIGHPIMGDKKYGQGRDSGTRLALHARSISFPHPYDGRQLAFTAPTPGYFRKLMA